MQFGGKMSRSTSAVFGIAKQLPFRDINEFIALLYTALKKKRVIDFGKRLKFLRTADIRISWHYLFTCQTL